VADPVLIDLAIKGQTVKAVVQANRNGYFYAVDRTNGKFLLASPYTKITWATGMGADGRPLVVPGMEPSETGTKVCPGLGGGHNWSATAYSLDTKLFYFGTADGCEIFFRTKQVFREGQWYQASTESAVPNEPLTGAVIAVDPATGATRWRYDLLTEHAAGMLATGGGLVFTGDAQGYVTALDAPAITYTVHGRQQIAVAAGSSIITFQLVDGK